MNESPANPKPSAAGLECGKRAAWWYCGWRRFERNLPMHHRRSVKTAFRVLGAVARRDVNKAMGWWPEGVK